MGWITFLGGPLAGVLALAYNVRQFGERRKAAYIAAGGIVGMALFLALVFQLPESTAGSFWLRSGTALVGLLAVLTVAETTQREKLRALKEAGGRDASGWLGFGMVLAGWAIILVVSVALAFVEPPFEGRAIAVNAGTTTVYLTDEADERDARKVGVELRQFGYFPVGEVAQVSRMADSLRLALMFIPEVESDSVFLGELRALAGRVGAAVQAHVQIVNVVDGFDGRRETMLVE